MEKKMRMTHQRAMDIFNNAVEGFKMEKDISSYNLAMEKFVRTPRGQALYEAMVNIRRRGEK